MTSSLSNKDAVDHKNAATPLIHSVSLLMYVKDQGFIVCTEKRKRSGKKRGTRVVPHFVGGRVEADETPLFAGCREFCEEVPFNIETAELEKAVVSAHYEFFDVCVSPQTNLYHRFYLIHVDSIKGHESTRATLVALVENFEPRPSELESLFYWDGASRLDNNDHSLTSKFLKSVDPEMVQNCMQPPVSEPVPVPVVKSFFARMFGY